MAHSKRVRRHKYIFFSVKCACERINQTLKVREKKSSHRRPLNKSAVHRCRRWENQKHSKLQTKTKLHNAKNPGTTTTSTNTTEHRYHHFHPTNHRQENNKVVESMKAKGLNEVFFATIVLGLNGYFIANVNGNEGMYRLLILSYHDLWFFTLSS